LDFRFVIRSVLGFAVAPLAAAIIFAAIYLVTYVLGTRGEAPVGWALDESVHIFDITSFSAYRIALSLGLAMYVLFVRRGWRPVWQSMVAGVVCALVGLTVSVDEFWRFSFELLPNRDVPEILQWVLCYVLAGVSGGLVFWIAAFAPLKRSAPSP
jgi:hypothetical protein